jgi:MFS family permease
MSYRFFHSRPFHKFLPIFLANLFFSFHAVLIVYINSSYLARYFSGVTVSLLFVASALVNIAFFLLASRILKRSGNRALFLFFLFLDALGVSALLFLHAPLHIALGFILYEASGTLIYYSLDIFLEDASEEAVTGSIRGAFLTAANVSLIICPLLVSFIAPNGEFIRIYLLSLLFLLPVILIGLFPFRKFKDAKQRGGYTLPFGRLFKEKSILRAALVRLTLDIFYCIMVVYLPIYLHTLIGFSWLTIGVIFAFMLLPFLIFEAPVGYLADNWCGEKEIMTLGLFLIGCALLTIPFLPAVPLYWIITLFVSRMGAAFTEVTVESYFFKHVDKADAGLISIFRMSWAGAYLIGPVLAALSLYLFPYPAMFFVLSFLVLDAMELSFHMRDTR